MWSVQERSRLYRAVAKWCRLFLCLGTPVVGTGIQDASVAASHTRAV